MKIEFRWEKIFDEIIAGRRKSTYRAKVLGGWLIKDERWDRSESQEALETVSISTVFIQDSEHVWEVE